MKLFPKYSKNAPTDHTATPISYFHGHLGILVTFAQDGVLGSDSHAIMRLLEPFSHHTHRLYYLQINDLDGIISLTGIPAISLTLLKVLKLSFCPYSRKTMGGVESSLPITMSMIALGSRVYHCPLYRTSMEIPRFFPLVYHGINSPISIPAFTQLLHTIPPTNY